MIEWHELLGSVGVVLIVASYFLLQLRRLSARSLVYSVSNGLGAGLILVSLIFDFNFPAAVVEIFWLLISLYGIGVWWRGKERPLV